MVLDHEKWHYPALGKLLALLREITSKDNNNFYYPNCFHSFRAEKVKSHEKVFRNHDFCDVDMPNEKKSKVLKYT